MTDQTSSNGSPPPEKNLQLIQVLRGIASLLVVLFHATVNFPNLKNGLFLSGFFSFGWAGVDIFFVLSGFIITYTSLRGGIRFNRLLHFVRRRFIRIFPAYWMILVLFLLLQVLFPSFYQSHYRFSPGNLFYTVFLLPGHSMVNGVSWTMSFELFFYGLFAFVFIIPKIKWSIILLVIYVSFIIMLPATGVQPLTGNWGAVLTSPMNVEFFMGVLATILIPRIPSKLGLPLILTGGLLFLGGGIYTGQDHFLLPNAFNRVLIFGVPSLLVISGLVCYETGKKLNVHGLLLMLGEASYSLYLLHLPLLAAGIKLLALFDIQNNVILELAVLVMLGAICYGSILFYRWMEKPLILKLNSAMRTGTVKLKTTIG